MDYKQGKFFTTTKKRSRKHYLNPLILTGTGLTDSPTGLLVYILEKFSTWTDINNREKTDGGLEEKWTKEKLIDNLMVYWSTKSITTSMRLYAETFNSRHFAAKIEE